jgi:hypothetical protein
LERSVGAFCAKAAPVKSAVPSNAAARYFDFIFSLHEVLSREVKVLLVGRQADQPSVQQQKQDDQRDRYSN